MAFRDSARLGGATVAILSVAAALGTVRPASAQEIERSLAGIRLGMRSTAVLAKYGNPNDVVIGDIGIRQAPGGGAGAANGQGGMPGMGGAAASPGPGGPGGALPGFGGAPMGFPGSPSSMGGRGGGPGMSGASAMQAPSGMGSPGMSMPGNPFGPSGEGGERGGSAAGAGGFGQTISPLANEQEVTWVYNRKVGNNVVSYEFLIGPSGNVSQIRVSGYAGGGTKTARSIGLGATYKDVVRIYGYPEDQQQVGNVLIGSYKQRAHVSFQFLNQSGQTDSYHSGYKVIAITIAQVD